MSVSTAPQGLAQLCKLAYIKVPELEEEFGIEAAEYLSTTIGDRVLTARIVERDTSGGKVKGQGTGPCLIVMADDPETQVSVNVAILEVICVSSYVYLASW